MWQYANTYLDSALSFTNQAWAHCGAIVSGNTRDCLYDLITAVYALRNASRYIIYDSYNPIGAPLLYWAIYYSVNYRTMCDGWAADSFYGRSPTIAYIDRMRQLIWNEPFNVIWAAKPEVG